jgi:DNA-binding beta-propeller fold protein YncE
LRNKILKKNKRKPQPKRANTATNPRMASASRFALSRQSAASARMWFLRALCAIAEGADVGVKPDAAAPECCLPAVLHDAQSRLCVMGGRAGMPRSLGSVYAGSVLRFLGGFRGLQQHRTVSVLGLFNWQDVAVTRDGSMLLVSAYHQHCVYLVDAATGDVTRTLGGGCGRSGHGPLQFNLPSVVCVSPDNFVFVAEYGNRRVQVLTPQLDFHGFVGVKHLHGPHGVCADTGVIAVSEITAGQIVLFSRRDGALLRRFGSPGRGAGQLACPLGLCFLGESGRIAVANEDERISVFSFDGTFVCHVSDTALRFPVAIACSAFGELVVATKSGVVVVSAGGEVLDTISTTKFTGVAVHGDSVFAVTRDGTCVVFA